MLADQKGVAEEKNKRVELLVLKYRRHRNTQEWSRHEPPARHSLGRGR